MLTLVGTGALVLLVLLAARRAVVAVWLAPYALGVAALGSLAGFDRPVPFALQASALALALAFGWLNRASVRRPAPSAAGAADRGASGRRASDRRGSGRRPWGRRPWGRRPWGRGPWARRRTLLRLAGRRPAPVAPPRNRTVVVPDQYLPRGRDVPTLSPGPSD
jgi:hypothetical protein